MLWEPTRDFYREDQEPTREEWARERAWDGTKWVTYVRGKHGGWDLQDRGGGRKLFAVENGKVRHVNFGPSLGEKQFVVVKPDGTGWFYAHANARLPEFTWVRAGDYVGEMGASGTAFTHLHLEYLDKWNDWYSTRYTDVLLELWKEGMAFTDAEREYLKRLVEVATANDIKPPTLVSAAKARHTHDENAPVAPHTHTGTVNVT